MIRFRHLEERLSPSKLYGIAFERHPKGKSLIILAGKHQYVFSTGPML